MKNFKFKMFIALITVSAVTFNSCTTEDPEAKKPQLNFLAGDDYKSTDGDIVSGSDFKVGLSASHDSKIETLEITVTLDGSTPVAPLNCTLCDTTFNETSFTIDFTNTVQNKPGTETWNFTIVDKDGNSTTKSITFNRTALPKAIRKIDVTLGNQNSANVGSALNMTDMSVNLLAAARAASAMMDLIYVVDGTGSSYFGAPSSDDVNTYLKTSDWTTRNASKIRQTNITVGQFSNMSDSKELLAEFTSSAATTQWAELKSGDVLFVNPVSASGKFALVKVSSIGLDNTISLEIIVEDD
ncbi:MAG: hypothetical protein ACI8SE_000198 [Bacteroidia bacterium]|jgi:hypothetical protein